jgi:polysaccharide export outer membrane protein
VAATPRSSQGFVVLNPGDLVTVIFSDIPPPGWPEHRQRIHDDGKITLPYNVSVIAAGKTPGQLEEAIRKEYVPKFFNQFTPTVRTELRHYYVDGEVRAPNRQEYHGKMTVLRAISTCGGFTDFANRKNIELRRATGEVLKINWHSAIKDARFDLPVYPDDQIIVHRSIF